MNTWIKVPWNKRVVVKNDTHQRVCVVMNSRPIIVSDNCEFYPRTWEGIRGQDGEKVTWHFPMGPVRTLLTYKDKSHRKWVSVIWR